MYIENHDPDSLWYAKITYISFKIQMIYRVKGEPLRYRLSLVTYWIFPKVGDIYMYSHFIYRSMKITI